MQWVSVSRGPRDDNCVCAYQQQQELLRSQMHNKMGSGPLPGRLETIVVQGARFRRESLTARRAESAPPPALGRRRGMAELHAPWSPLGLQMLLT